MGIVVKAFGRNWSKLIKITPARRKILPGLVLAGPLALYEQWDALAALVAALGVTWWQAGPVDTAGGPGDRENCT